MEEKKTIKRTTVEVSLGTIMGCPSLLMGMKRWRDNLMEELGNCLDPHECAPARWQRYSMENWWAGHPEYDANDGIPEGTPSADYYKYTWVDAVRDTLGYLPMMHHSSRIVDNGATLLVEMEEVNVLQVMQFIILNSGFREKNAFFYKKQRENMFLLRFVAANARMEDDGWKRYTWSDAKFDEAKENGRVVDVDAFNNRKE